MEGQPSGPQNPTVYAAGMYYSTQQDPQVAQGVSAITEYGYGQVAIPAPSYDRGFYDSSSQQSYSATSSDSYGPGYGAVPQMPPQNYNNYHQRGNRQQQMPHGVVDYSQHRRGRRTQNTYNQPLALPAPRSHVDTPPPNFPVPVMDPVDISPGLMDIYEGVDSDCDTGRRRRPPRRNKTKLNDRLYGDKVHARTFKAWATKLQGAEDSIRLLKNFFLSEHCRINQEP